MHTIKRIVFRVLIVFAVLYLLLLIPDTDNNTITEAGARPFSWNKDELWNKLEADFKRTRQLDPVVVDTIIADLFHSEARLFNRIADPNISATDRSFDSILANYFSLASNIAARSNKLDSFISYYNKVRISVKQQSTRWGMGDADVRNSIYKLLYGMRAATEEVLLQSTNERFDPVLLVKNEPSATASTNIFGIKVHSGDLLVSRGGAEVSALIARGNDYPANFSHVALVYVNEETNVPYLIEAHIEKGVAVSSAEDYVKDKKLRFMVLRPRADLPVIIKDPLLPQRAARLAYDEAMKRHIPYDFKMNFYDSSAMFCSEVGSYAYRKEGIRLWQAVSTISSPGVVNWLHSFGVENFVTQMPGDLEYDPQLSVVAEWRDPETLFKDHLDNAVTDILLEKANRGEPIKYNHWQLPLVRLIKVYCIVKNFFGKTGIIPEGMSATQALRNQTFVAMHTELKERMMPLIITFEKDNGYRPPYWQLIKIARSAGN